MRVVFPCLRPWSGERWANVFLAFVGLGFVSPSLPFWAMVFYVFFIPLLALRFMTGRALALPRDSVCGVLFVAWGLCSLLWSPTWHGGLDGICTMLFLLGGVQAMRDPLAFVRALQCVVVVGATLNSAVALGEIWLGLQHQLRPGGAGMFHVTLPAAIIAGIAVLWASEWMGRRMALGPAVAVAVNVALMLASGSRMPCLALLVALFWLLVCQGWRSLSVVACVAGGAVGCVVLMPHMVLQLLHGAVQRGDSFHRAIWLHVWQTSMQNPFLGHGLGASTVVSVAGQVFVHAHNLCLGILYAFGLSGLALFVSAFLFPIRDMVRNGEMMRFPVVVFVALSTLTDVAQPLKGPSEVWYIVWLVWLYCVAAAQGQEHKLKRGMG